MSIKPPSENISELDFEQIRANLLSFVKNNSEFKDYDFEASGLNFLVDLLAYNTQYSAYYLNQVANEMFLDTAQRRKNAVSIAKQMGYLTNSKKSSIANIYLKLTGPELQNNIGTISIPRYTVFYGSNSTGTFPFVSWSTVLLNSSNNFSTNIDLVQGQFISQEIVVNNLLLEKKFKIESPDIDIDHLDVFVLENSNTTDRVQYKRVSDITLLNHESEVYYLEQDYDGKYQIVFGDGVIGRDIKNNNVVIAEFIATTGDGGNNCQNFDIADRSILSSTYTISAGVNEKQGSSQGHAEESIEAIRNNARKMFFSQNRTVTERDCEVQLQKYFPFIDSISVWGGEKNTPPIYGSVFCCVKPKGRTLLTQDEKDFIISRLQQLNIITITPRIVDPEYTYIMLDIEVVYNSIYLNIGDIKIRDMILQNVSKFAESSLLKFNRSFQVSSIQNLIQDIDQYFMGSSVSLKMYQKKDIKIGFGNYYKIDFNNELEKGTLSSTLFSYLNTDNIERHDCHLKETEEMIEEEVEQAQFSTTAEKKTKKYNVDIRYGSSVLHKGIGSINYEDGILELENFNPTRISNDASSEMTFTVGTKEYKLNPKKEQIFTIDKADIQVNSIANDDEFSKSTTLENASLFET